MERAGADDLPEDAERQGLGTPATRASILEKLVQMGFVERRGKQLLPTKDGHNLACASAGGADLSPAYGTVGNGADGHCQGAGRPGGLHGWHCRNDKGPDRKLLPDQRGRAEVVSNRACGYRQMSALRGKASTRAKRTTTAETEAASLSCGRMTDFLRNGARRSPRRSPPRSLKTGKAKVKGLRSMKTGKTYDGTVLLADTGGKYVNYRMEQRGKN